MATNPQATDAELTRLASLSAPTIGEIPFRLIASHERKTSQLLPSAIVHEEIKSRNSYFPFSFETPIFLLSIRISVRDFADGVVFDYMWQGIDGQIHDGDAKVKDSEVYIYIRGIATAIAFTPPKAVFAKPYITEVNLFGFEITQAGDFIDFANRVNSIRESASEKIFNELNSLEEERRKVAALQAQRGTLNQDITTLKASISREQSKLKRIEAQRDESILKNGEISRSISDEESRLYGIKSEISRGSTVRSRLAQSITDKRSELSNLQSNIHLFPSELSEFSRQGAKDSRLFFFLSLAPLGLIIAMFYLLVEGAADLTTRITGSEAINLPALAISRAPYVAVACAIITASYYIAKMLILEMIRISRQRLALTKISIIAKDISSSIDSDLGLSDDDRYVRRLALKMDMMKNHLQEYISTDFAPTLPKDIIPSVAALGLVNLGKPSSETDAKKDAT